MRVPIFQVDAFTNRLFAGNPAAVMVFDAFPDDAVLQALAAENNLAETAFIVRIDDDYRLRWFTPTVEMPLCGHATLASAAVVMERLEPGRTSVTFGSASGPLATRRDGDRYVLDFPARASVAIDEPAGMTEALGVRPVAVSANEFDWLVVLSDADTVRDLKPDIAGLAALGRSGVIVTAEGSVFDPIPAPALPSKGRERDLEVQRLATPAASVPSPSSATLSASVPSPSRAGPGWGWGRPIDFTSRYFAPNVGIPEDPVTGGAHCTLAPYWSARTGRTTFHARQASARGGDVFCRLVGERVELAGDCVFYLEGSATV